VSFGENLDNNFILKSLNRKMTFELLTTCLILSLIVSLLTLTHFVTSIVKVKRKYSHIPGPTQKGITGFFLGDIPQIMK